MHSQCFLVLHQSEGCELVKLWAASGTFPVVDRRGAQQRLHWAACKDSHFISWSAHIHTQKAPFHRKSCYHFSDTQTQRKHWHWTSYQQPRNRSCTTDGLTPSIQSLTDENKWDLLFCFCLISPDLSVYLGSGMVLFYIGSDKTSSIVMPPEDPVRQDMQFYYVVSRGITYSCMQMCTFWLSLTQTVRFPTRNCIVN